MKRGFLEGDPLLLFSLLFLNFSSELLGMSTTSYISIFTLCIVNSREWRKRKSWRGFQKPGHNWSCIFGEKIFLPISTKMKRIGHTKFRKCRRDIVFVNYQSNDIKIKGMFLYAIIKELWLFQMRCGHLKQGSTCSLDTERKRQSKMLKPFDVYWCVLLSYPGICISRP